jgi:hypothetical protein
MESMNTRYEMNGAKSQPTTKASQDAPEHRDEPATPRAFESDAQQPTHDALSDIYNRGYSA